jgi:hypothetical protein
LEAEHKTVVEALLRRYYGPRCERFDPRQLALFEQCVEQHLFPGQEAETIARLPPMLTGGD